MQYTHILGIDISKDKFDVSLSSNEANDKLISHKFTNNIKGFEALLSWLRKQQAQPERVLICMENTGLYSRSIASYLTSKRSFVWLENALSIKWSGGLQRGKTDTLDAERICLYAFRN